MQILKNMVAKSNSRSAIYLPCMVMMAFLFLSASRSPLQGDVIMRENKVKAAFVYNFTQFVKWPSGSFTDNASPFVIGILGKESFAGLLNQIIDGEQVDGHPIVIRTFDSAIPEIWQCHILFLEKSFSETPAIADAATNSAVLTISDHENFMEMKGILRFFVEDGKVRFEINRNMAEKAGLTINPKLLKLATIYKN